MADEEDKKQSHTLADHLLGRDFVHEHDGDADHDHDHFDFDETERLEDNPIWIQDHVTLVTVGIDIGSSGTQVIFCRLESSKVVGMPAGTTNGSCESTKRRPASSHEVALIVVNSEAATMVPPPGPGWPFKTAASEPQ